MSEKELFNMPIETKVYDQIKPILEPFFGFKEQYINELFFDACVEIRNSLSEEEKAKTASLDIYEFIKEQRKQGHNITLTIFNPQDFHHLSEKYQLHTATVFTLLMVTHLYVKFHHIPRFYSDHNENIETEVDLENLYCYKDYVRAEMLQLYNFINDWKKQPFEEPITLACGSKKLRLDNKSNWMFTAINNYLKTYLRVDSVESAKEELETQYNPKAGKKMNKYQSIVTCGIDCLYQEIYQTEEISNEMCCLIRDYLKYIGQPISNDDFDHPDDIKNIRSRIRYIRKSDYTPDWFSEDPDDFPAFKFAYW